MCLPAEKGEMILTIKPKRKAKRRKLRRPSYYLKLFQEPRTSNEILDLLSEAASMPMSKISEKEYEEIYWRAHELLEMKGE